MTHFERQSRLERELKWAKIWFGRLAEFCQKANQPMWEFTADDVIAFSRQKRDLGWPAHKRRMVVIGLMNYSERVQHRSPDDLKPIQRKLGEIAQQERARKDGYDQIEDLVGKIDPNEADVIQAFRRRLRCSGKAVATEKAYVGKVRAFMRSLGLKSNADFARVSGRDVESHLTDLAVDGNVAASTQNQAFYALLFLFEHVLKRDIGQIKAIRASKGKQIPTVMSTAETAEVLSKRLRLQSLSVLAVALSVLSGHGSCCRIRCRRYIAVRRDRGSVRVAACFAGAGIDCR